MQKKKKNENRVWMYEFLIKVQQLRDYRIKLITNTHTIFTYALYTKNMVCMVK